MSGEGKLQRTYPSVSVDAGNLRDLGTIWLGKSGALEGQVLDAAGGKVARADVRVFAGGGTMLEIARNFMKLFEELHKDPEPLQQVKTDASGRFRIESLPPGPITLVVNAAGFQQKLQPEVMTSQGAAGGEVRVQLSESDPLGGSVVDETGRGVAGARVAFLNKNDMGSVLYGRHATLTNDEGRFTITAPPAGGEFVVIVTAEGYPNLLTEITPGGSEIRLQLKPGAELTLRLVEAVGGRPVEGARLMGMISSSGRFGSDDTDFASVVTDHRGEAVVLARPGKLQMLWMSHDELGSGAYSPMMGGLGGKGLITGPDDTDVKSPRTTLEFKVGAGVTIRGKVTDEAGEPVVGARVLATGAMGMGGSGTTSDAEGRYELTGQSAPVAAVLATAPGYIQKIDPKTYQGMMGAQGEDLERDIVMQKAATVAGRVVDANGKPLSGARVRVSEDGPMAMIGMLTGTTAESITNKEGRYVISGARPGSKGKIIGRLAGWLDSGSEAFEIKPGAANEAPDLVMKKGAVITLQVQDPEGASVRGARVEVDVDASGDEVEWDPMGGFQSYDDQVTREGGKAEIRDLPDGKVTATASKAGLAANRIAFEVKDGKLVSGAQAVVQLREAFTLRGRVIDAEGQPAKGVEVEVNPIQWGAKAEADASWAPNAATVTDAQGRFTIEGMPDVEITIELSGDGYRERKDKLASPRGEAELTIQRMDAGAAKRIEAIEAELMKTYQQYGAAKTEDEKQQVAKKMQALQQELQKLQGGDEGPDAVADDE